MEHGQYQPFATVREERLGEDVVYVFGDVDVYSSAAFRNAIEESATRGGRVVLDLSECRYLDAAGITVLIVANRTLGPRLQLLVASDSQVMRIMRLTRLDRTFNVVTELQTRARLASVEAMDELRSSPNAS